MQKKRNTVFTVVQSRGERNSSLTLVRTAVRSGDSRTVKVMRFADEQRIPPVLQRMAPQSPNLPDMPSLSRPSLPFLPNTRQKRSVSSPAPVTTVVPSGLVLK